MLGVFGTSREKALFMTLMTLMNLFNYHHGGPEWVLWLGGLTALLTIYHSYCWYKTRG